MNEHSDEIPDWNNQRMKIIGLGESSIRKSYYPELQQRLSELEKTNTELLDAFEEIQSKEEELRENYEELITIQSALDLARKKLQILNTLTFQEIQNALFSLNGYLTLTKELVITEPETGYVQKSLEQMQTIERLLHVAKQFQDMGISPPRWQNVLEVFLFAISHLDLSSLQRDVNLAGLTIYADPLLEDALFYILENIPIHGTCATKYQAWYFETEEGVKLIFADNGTGIEPDKKQQIFESGFGTIKQGGLFITHEILSITSITIEENGIFGEGARFEITIPEGRYRISPQCSGFVSGTDQNLS